MGSGLQCLDPVPEHQQQGRLSSWSRMLCVLGLEPEARHITVGKMAASTPEQGGRKQWLDKGCSLLCRAEDISKGPAAAILDGAASEAGKGLVGHLFG